MTGINGNFGLFGNNGNRRIETNAANNKKEVKTNIPINKQSAAEHVENKELGDELLTGANFYPGLNLNTSKKVTNKVQTGDLDDLTKTVQTMNLSNVTRADKKAAFNLVQDPLVKAYMYGNINESTMSVLSKLDGFESFTQDMADDLLAEVEIA